MRHCTWDNPHIGKAAFGDYLRRLVRAHGYSIEGFRKKFHLALQPNVEGKVWPSGHKIARIINALGLLGRDAEAVWQQYLGEPPQTMRGYLQAGVRRYGYRGLVRETDGEVSVITLGYMLLGYTRRPVD